MRSGTFRDDFFSRLAHWYYYLLSNLRDITTVSLMSAGERGGWREREMEEDRKREEERQSGPGYFVSLVHANVCHATGSERER